MKIYNLLRILLTLIILLQYGCASTEKLLEERSVIGMSKSELLDYTVRAPDGDSPLVFCTNEFFKGINYEISWGFSENYFYVFRDVIVPNNCSSYLASLFDVDANGYVAAYFRDYKSAKRYVNDYKIKLSEEAKINILRLQKLKKLDVKRKEEAKIKQAENTKKRKLRLQKLKKLDDKKIYEENQRVYVGKEDKFKRYAKCYGEMTTAHKARGFHDSNRITSIKVKETVCKAYSEGEELNYEGKR